jgi:hypothetical protein
MKILDIITYETDIDPLFITKNVLDESTDISSELQQLIDTSIMNGNKMASSRTLKYQLYVPRVAKVNEDIKPNAELWTSTAEFRGDNDYTSAWAEWCYYNMPQWLAKRGKLYQVQPGARVLYIGSDAVAKKVARILGHEFAGSKYTILQYPWEKLSEHFDAIRYPARLKNRFTSRMNNILMSLWDVESTAWFRTDKLKLLNEVDIKTREW